MEVGFGYKQKLYVQQSKKNMCIFFLFYCMTYYFSQKLRLDCIVDQVHLQCLPSLYRPDTVYLNTYSNVKKDQVIPLFYIFDLLPDISFHQLQTELKMYGVYNQYSSTRTCEIDWKLADDDISWTSNLFSYFYFYKWCISNLFFF